VCVSPVLGPGHGELTAGCKTGIAVVVTVCGFSWNKREDEKWLRRGNELQVGKSYGGGAEARLGFEGQVRVCQVNKEGTWLKGRSILDREISEDKGKDHGFSCWRVESTSLHVSLSSCSPDSTSEDISAIRRAFEWGGSWCRPGSDSEPGVGPVRVCLPLGGSGATR